MKVQVTSYKKAQVFKKDYVRVAGQFVSFEKCSGNHRHAIFEVSEGDEFDARGSVYRDGVTKWDAASCQSWAKFKVTGGKLIPMNYGGQEIACPNWIRVLEVDDEQAVVGDEIKSFTA